MIDAPSVSTTTNTALNYVFGRRCVDRYTVYTWQTTVFLLMPRPSRSIKQKPAADLFNYYHGRPEERWGSRRR